MKRRHFLSGLAATALASPAIAQTGPMRVIFPFALGGAGDVISRIVADEVGRALGETAVVESRPGGGGQAGVRAVLGAPADGRTLLCTPVAPITIHPILFPQLGYDPFTDLAPISQVATFDFALAVKRETPVATLSDLGPWLRADPARATFGSPGAGTLPHFFGVMVARTLGLDLRHAAYRGSAAALAELLGGHVPMVISTTSDLVELARDGRIRLLAVSAASRSPFLPDVPTFREGGMPIVGDGWFAVYARAGAPTPVIERLSSIVAGAFRSEPIRQRMLAMASMPTGTTGDDLARIQRAHHEAWAPVVRASGFRPEP